MFNHQTTSLKPWNPRYQTLDHWRGFAALWIMIFHGFGILYQETLHPAVEWLTFIAEPGWLGVHLFFVISGYCIAANLYKLPLTSKTSIDFLQGRAWRLLPVYWSSFLVTLCLNFVSSPFNSTRLWDIFPQTWQAWIGNLFLIQPYLKVPYYNVVYWSLVVEVGFYLIVAFLLQINSKKVTSKFAQLIALSLTIITIFIPLNTQLIVFNYWPEFVCGIFVFNALHAQGQKKIYHSYAYLSLIFTLGLLSIWLNWNSDSHSQLWLSALFAILLYLLYDFDHQISSIKQLQWLKFTGIMSYSLYLFHVPIQGRVINLGLRFIPPESWMILLLQILGWLSAILISYLFYRCIEKPINDWRHQQKTLNLHYENPLNSRS